MHADHSHMANQALLHMACSIWSAQQVLLGRHHDDDCCLTAVTAVAREHLEPHEPQAEWQRIFFPGSE